MAIHQLGGDLVYSALLRYVELLLERKLYTEVHSVESLADRNVIGQNDSLK